MSQKMVAATATTTEAEIMCQQSMPVLDVKYHLRVASSPELSSSPPPSAAAGEVRVSEVLSADVSRFESVRVFLFVDLMALVFVS